MYRRFQVDVCSPGLVSPIVPAHSCILPDWILALVLQDLAKSKKSLDEETAIREKQAERSLLCVHY
eukprot:7076907-Pyramimonas_sp.AAC.1